MIYKNKILERAITIPEMYTLKFSKRSVLLTEFPVNRGR